MLLLSEVLSQLRVVLPAEHSGVLSALEAEIGALTGARNQAEASLAEALAKVAEHDQAVADGAAEIERLTSEREALRSEALMRYRAAVTGGDALLAQLVTGASYDEIDAAAQSARSAIDARIASAVEAAKSAAAEVVPAGGSGRTPLDTGVLGPREKILAGLAEVK